MQTEATDAATAFRADLGNRSSVCVTGVGGLALHNCWFTACPVKLNARANGTELGCTRIWLSLEALSGMVQRGP